MAVALGADQYLVAENGAGRVQVNPAVDYVAATRCLRIPGAGCDKRHIQNRRGRGRRRQDCGAGRQSGFVAIRPGAVSINAVCTTRRKTTACHVNAYRARRREKRTGHTECYSATARGLTQDFCG